MINNSTGLTSIIVQGNSRPAQETFWEIDPNVVACEETLSQKGH